MITKNEKFIANLKNKFIELLKSTNRENIDVLIDNIDEEGFFEAPASTKFHGNYPGGLCEHSLNVYTQAMYIYKVECKLKKDLQDSVSSDNIIIASLLHDICKSDLYITKKKWVKDDVNNKWNQEDVYDHDYSNLPVGHGEKSVIKILQYGIKLMENELLAIRWHMGAFDLSTYNDAKKSFNTACDKNALISIIICADMLASRIMEVTDEKNSDK